MSPLRSWARWISPCGRRIPQTAWTKRNWEQRHHGGARHQVRARTDPREADRPLGESALDRRARHRDHAPDEVRLDPFGGEARKLTVHRERALAFDLQGHPR